MPDKHSIKINHNYLKIMKLFYHIIRHQIIYFTIIFNELFKIIKNLILNLINQQKNIMINNV